MGAAGPVGEYAQCNNTASTSTIVPIRGMVEEVESVLLVFAPEATPGERGGWAGVVVRGAWRTGVGAGQGADTTSAGSASLHSSAPLLPPRLLLLLL